MHDRVTLSLLQQVGTGTLMHFKQQAAGEARSTVSRHQQARHTSMPLLGTSRWVRNCQMHSCQSLRPRRHLKRGLDERVDKVDAGAAHKLVRHGVHHQRHALALKGEVVVARACVQVEAARALGASAHRTPCMCPCLKPWLRSSKGRRWWGTAHTHLYNTHTYTRTAKVAGAHNAAHKLLGLQWTIAAMPLPHRTHAAS